MLKRTIKTKPFAKSQTENDQKSQRKRLMMTLTPDRGGGGGEEDISICHRLHHPHHYPDEDDGPTQECQCPSLEVGEEDHKHDHSSRISSISPRTHVRRRRKPWWKELPLPTKHSFLLLFYILLCNCLVQLALAGGSTLVTPVYRPSKSSSMTFSKLVEGTGGGGGGSGGSRGFSMSDTTTSRTSTSFLMTDAAIPNGRKRSSKSSGSGSPTTSVTKLRSRNISHLSSSSSSNNNNNYDYVSNNNAAILYGTPAADRRSSKSSGSSSGSRHRSSHRRNRSKNKVETTTMSSIDRPFYTKLTMSDAISKSPSVYYGRGGTTTKKPSRKGSRSKYSSGSSSASGSASTSSSEKYSKTRSKSGSKLSKSSSSSNKNKLKKMPKFSPMPPTPVQPHYEYNEDGLDYLGEDYPGLVMPHTTEKSYHPPKLSLEPFFDFLTSLATASREVIMSKESFNGHQPGPGTTENPVGSESGDDNEEEEEEQEVELDGVKNDVEEEPPKKKKGRRGSKEQRQKSSEESESKGGRDDDNGDGDNSGAAVPIPLPDKFIGEEEMIRNDDNDGGTDGDVEEETPNFGGLHILDVLRTPMIADYGSTSTSTSTTTTTTTPAPPIPPPRIIPPIIRPFPPPTRQIPPSAQPFRASPMDDIIGKPIMKPQVITKPPETILARPPSGRSNLLEGQSQGQAPPPPPAAAVAHPHPQGWNPSAGSAISALKDNKQLRSELPTDAMESFTDHQAQESISHSQMVPPPSQSFSNDDQQQQQSPPPSDPTTGTSMEANQDDGSSSDTVSKYPASFVYHQPPGGGQMPPGSRLYMSPPSPYGPPASPYRMAKQRPNLQSYYDPTYHHYTGAAEAQQQQQQQGQGQQVASEMIGLRHPYGPPHFTPPPHHRILPSGAPPPPPNRFMSRPPFYHHRPGPGGFMNMLMGPHRGTHYNGHHEQPKPLFANDPSGSGPSAAASSPQSSYEQDLTGSHLPNNDNGDPSNNNSPSLNTDLTGSSADEQYSEDNSITNNGEHSENKKIGIMESFDVFYKEYKIMTWVAVFIATSMALLSLLVYLYVNNPPTEVVQARQLLQWGDTLFKNNPQIMKFLSSLKRSSSSSFDDDSPSTREEYMKPLGKGFGAKSGRQKRKHTRAQQDKGKQDKLLRRNLSLVQPSTKPILISRKRSRSSRNGTSSNAPSNKTVSRRPLQINKHVLVEKITAT